MDQLDLWCLLLGFVFGWLTCPWGKRDYWMAALYLSYLKLTGRSSSVTRLLDHPECYEMLVEMKTYDFSYNDYLLAHASYQEKLDSSVGTHLIGVARLYVGLYWLFFIVTILLGGYLAPHFYLLGYCIYAGLRYAWYYFEHGNEKMIVAILRLLAIQMVEYHYAKIGEPLPLFRESETTEQEAAR